MYYNLALDSSAVQNPFGSAKPRETVLAAKQGKKEEDILREELIKDKINVRICRARWSCVSCFHSPAYDMPLCAAATDSGAKR